MVNASMPPGFSLAAAFPAVEYVDAQRAKDKCQSDM